MNTDLVLLLSSAYFKRKKEKKRDGVLACQATGASHVLVCTLPTLYQVAPAGRSEEDIPKSSVHLPSPCLPLQRQQVWTALSWLLASL